MILQRAIEDAAIPTVLVAALPAVAAQLCAPRIAAPDTPMGATMGAPDDPAQQSRILLASLRLLETATVPGQIVPLAETYRTGSETQKGWTVENTDIRVATFDCYGTLVDWEGGLGTFLYALALKHEAEPADNGWAMRERWEAIQFDFIQGEYRPYKEVLAQSLRRWMQERGYPWDEAEGDALVRAMRSWQPFPDTRPALLQARDAGLKLAILSNTDRNIIAHTLRQLDLPFADVVTAEDCGSYKPSPRNFEQTLARIGEAPERVLHVAFGFKYDIGPAQRLGMRTAWVNRHAEPRPGDERPDHTWRDLWGLAALAGGHVSAS